MAWFTGKAKNLLARGKAAEPDDSPRVVTSGMGKTSYNEAGLSLPLTSGNTSFIDGALEQIQADASIKAVLEKCGIPELSENGEVPAAVDPGRRRSRELPEEEHRLLTAFVLLGNGDAKFRGGYFTSAEASYREALKAGAATKEKNLQGICLSALGASLAMQGKNEEAMKLVEDALRRKPDLAEAWYNKGFLLLLVAQYEEGVACFDEALVHKPALAEAWYNKGVALGNLNRYEEALPCFTEALGRNLQGEDPWLGKGAAQLMLGRYEDAIASFEGALRHRGDFAAALVGKGLALMMLRRYEEALPYFDQALELSPEFAEAWVGRGQTLGEMGRHQDAGTCFDRALLYKPDLANAWLNKGVALEKLGWWKQALAAHERARSLEKGSP
jgi:tetratricopeptide (TPR) repeat protein